MLILSARQVRRTLPMPAAIDAMQRAFLAISAGDAQMPLRTHIDSPDGGGTTLVMPAQVRSAGTDALTVKVVSVFAGNPDRGLPRILATLLAVDPHTGEPVALMDGTTITAIRTAAASAAATDVLARPDAETLAVIGAGVQAREHIAAMHCIRDLRKTCIVARDRVDGERLVEQLASDTPPTGDLTICDTADEAVAQADIVCTVTTSREPVFSAAALRPGTHVNAVGSYQPDTREIPAASVKAARVFVDHRPSALAEAGDLIMPLAAGLIDDSHILGEVGDVLAGRITGRGSASDITLFKSVGCAAEDSLAASTVLSSARELGIGQEITLA